MAMASKAATIGIMIISLSIGVLFYYFFSTWETSQKKKYASEIISQLINLILFVWVAKILLNLSLFMEDPLAVLAYPGDSNAFYLAILFTGILIIYKTLRKNLNLFAFAESFTYVFFISLFFYEFIQLFLEEDVYSIGYLILSAVLLIIYYLLQGRVKSFVLLMMILSGWSIGIFILSYYYPFVAVFGYLLQLEFIIVFYLCCVAVLIYFERKGKHSWE